MANRLIEFRFENIHRHVPALHATAQLNLAICVFVMWRQGISPLAYAWTPLLTAFSIWRVIAWARFRRSTAALSIPRMHRTLRGITFAALGSVVFVSVFAAATFAMGIFGGSVVIPVSLAFGTFAIAHCMASMRGAAIAVIALGVLPSALAMWVTGAFEARILAITLASVSLLNIGFLREYHRSLIARLELSSEIQRLADHDALTGLLNRRALFERLDEAVARRAPFVLAVLDLDGFKQLNDTHGHLAGDEALRVVAGRMREAAVPGDHLARLGGDEFVMVTADSGVDDTAENRLAALVRALALPHAVAGAMVNTPASLGFAHFPADGATGDELYAVADAALLDAKRAGKGRATRGRTARVASV